MWRTQAGRHARPLVLRVCAIACQHATEADHSSVGEMHRLICQQLCIVGNGAVGVPQIEEQHLGGGAEQQGMPTRDGRVVQHDVVVVAAADRCALPSGGRDKITLL